MLVVTGTWILLSHSVGKFIIPIDKLIFFRGVGQPPTSYGAWKVPKKSMVFLDKLIRGACDHPIKLPTIRGTSRDDGEMLKMILKYGRSHGTSP